MFKHAYETTPCSSYNLGVITEGVRRAFIEGELGIPQTVAQSFKDTTLKSIHMLSGEYPDIPPFAHPLTITFPTSDQAEVVLDLRNVTSRGRDGAIKINAPADLNFLLLRGVLQRAWTTLGPDDLMSLGSFPLSVYSRWLSENISRRLGLDANTQMIVTIVCGFFYLNMFWDEEDRDPNEHDRIKMASQVARATYISAEKCIEVIETLKIPENVHDLIENLQEATESVRLQKFNAGLLYSIIGGGWFGANAREVLAVAVEHPPTFLALVYTALTDRSYKRSLFAKMVLSMDKNKMGQNFTYNLTRLPQR